jgi:two-component system OmpR family sensor kinase
MSRLPIRARLTAAFAVATALVLAGAALFVHERLRADLDESVHNELRARAAALLSQARDGGAVRPSPGDEPDEEFAQVLTRHGRVIAATGGVRGAALNARERSRAVTGTLITERRVPGIDGTTRLRAAPDSLSAGRPVLVVAGRSLDDRDEALAGLRASFAIGGPLAILAASLLGYALATAGLAPIERMRRRASEVSLRSVDERLPLPAAHDEVRRLGETLNEMLDRLRRSFDRERRFVADASHELRTPVAVIKTELETALRAAEHPPQVREALVAAVEECDHLAQLAEDLLVLARASEEALPVRPEPLSARAELERARERFADRAAHAHRHIEVRADDGTVLHADPQRLRQAIGNLVDNALRHGAGDVILAARNGDGFAEIEIRDEGPGFSPALAASAFERFTRGSAARTERGAGLGLAIVRAIAEAHGGSAELAPGPGAAVRIRLPQVGLS